MSKSVQKLFNQAIGLHTKGDLAGAEPLYRQIIEKDARIFAANANLGTIYFSQGKWQEAELFLQRALSLDNTNAELNYKYAISLHQQGKLNEAIQTYKKTIILQPNHAEAYSNLGVAFKQQGQLREAIYCYHNALRIHPDFPEAYCNLGQALKGLREWKESISAFNMATTLKPNYPEAHYNLGHTLQQMGQIEEARLSFEQALKFKSNYPEAYNCLGAGYYYQGQLDMAISCYQKAINLFPTYAEAYSNLGVVYKDLAQFEQAIQYLHLALAYNPTCLDAHINLGLTLKLIGKTREAITVFEKVITLYPESADGQYYLGLSYYENENISEAILAYQKALDLKPDYPDARLSLSIALLQLGDFEQGWKLFEARFKAKPEKFPIPSFPAWDYSLNQNSELIILEEQGIGDLIQFMRYGTLLKQNLGSVSIAVKENLVPLVKMTHIFDEIYVLPMDGSLVPSTATWAYLLSIPAIFGVTTHSPLLNAPYLTVNSEQTAKWHQKIHNQEAFIIGLNWQGNPNTEKNDFIGRSFPLSTYEPLAEIPETQFVSLQKGFGSEQLETCTFKDKFVDCQSEINETWDWAETAAIVQACDLIITSDTSIAHLAGALGKPCWILLKKQPDWRWGLEGETSLWYPSARLFRQTESGNWIEVICQVKEALQKMVNAD